jgi:hypothetical protein
LTVVGYPNVEVEEVIFYLSMRIGEQADQEGKIIEKTEKRVFGKWFYKIKITPGICPTSWPDELLCLSQIGYSGIFPDHDIIDDTVEL